MTARDRQQEIPSRASRDEIASRAYARYLERGGADGSDVNDWLEAERELNDSGPTD